ncbi:Uncharacterised protein [Achromobacter xylosoxidans]|nr:Uncharacterised protein [Achromobacter xylosoxidans]
MPRLQRHVAVEGQQVARIQRHVAKASRRDLVHANTAQAIVQRGAFRGDAGRQQARARRLRNAQLTRPYQGLLRAGRVQRGFQLQRQGSARGAGAARRGPHRAIQVEAGGGGQRDLAALAANPPGARAGAVIHRHVHGHRRTRRFQLRARPNDDELAFDGDAPAIELLAVAAATGVHGRRRNAAHVEPRARFDPDRVGQAAQLRGGPLVIRAPRHHDLAAGRLQRALHPHQPARLQADGLARVDPQHGILADPQGAHRLRRRRNEGGQRQAGPEPLAHPAGDGILLEQRRRPQRQRVIEAGQLRIRRLGPGTIDRHRHVQRHAVGNGQALRAVDVVAREPALEQVAAQHQAIGAGIGIRRIADQHAVGADPQGAAAVDAVAIHRAGQRHPHGSRTGHAAVQRHLLQRHVAALAAAQPALDIQGRARTRIQHAARRDGNRAGGAQRDLPAIAPGQRIDVLRRAPQIGPQAADIDACAGRDLDPRRGIGGRRQENLAFDALQHIAGSHAAAARRQVALDGDVRRV